MNKRKVLIPLAILLIFFASILLISQIRNSDLGYETYSSNTDIYDVNYLLLNDEVLGSDTVNIFIEEKVEEFKENTDEYFDESNNLNHSFKHTFDSIVRTYETNEYVSHVVYFGEYTGGANSNEWVQSFVFNKETGEGATISDLIGEGERDEFVSEIKNYLNNLPESIGIRYESVEELSFNSLNNFFIEDNKINVLFSKYETAPGAAGIISASISF